MVNRLMEQAKSWCAGRLWWWRLGLLIWFGFVFVDYLKNPNLPSLFSPLNLGIHELGHLMFAWFGQFLAVAGGTITQLTAPVYGMWNFYKQKDFFAIALCFGWLSTNLFGISQYMADARSMKLQLVSLGGGFGHDTIHDWNYLLGHVGLLPFDHILSGFVWFWAVMAMLTCFTAGGWLIWQMMSLRVSAK